MAPSTGGVSTPRLLFYCRFGRGRSANDLKALNISRLRGNLQQKSSKTNLDGRCRESRASRATQWDERRPTCTSGDRKGTPSQGLHLSNLLQFQPHLIVWESRNESNPDSLNLVPALFTESNQHRQLQPDRQIKSSIPFHNIDIRTHKNILSLEFASWINFSQQSANCNRVYQSAMTTAHIH